MATAKLAPKPKPAGESEPEDPVPSVPLSGLEDDSLASLGAAFSDLRLRTPEGKAKEKDTGDGGAEDDREDEHVRTDDVSSGERPSESAPSATEHSATSSPTATTLPAIHPATFSPATTLPVAEGTGFTGMPYPTHGVEPLATELPMAPPVSEPVASCSSYVGIHEPAPCPEPGTYPRAPFGVCPLPMPGYTMPEPCITSLSGLRGPESCGGQSKGSGRSSNESLTRFELKLALRGATADLVGDLTQEIRAKLEPLIPPQGSPVTIGASPHRVQANHLVVGLTHTLGGVISRPMPTPAAVPRSAFVPTTAQPPYGHVENSTRAELDQLGLTALRAGMDVEPYGSSDWGGDRSDDEPPSLSSASPSEDDDPEDHENSRGKREREEKEERAPREASLQGDQGYCDLEDCGEPA